MVTEFIEILETLSVFLSEHGAQLVVFLTCLPFLILALVLVPSFMFRGYKKGIYRSLISLGCSVSACALSVLLAKLFSSAGAALFGNAVVNAVNDLLPSEMSTLSVGTLTYFPSFLRGIVSAVLSFPLFVLIFAVLLTVSRVVTSIFSKPILTKKDASAGFRVGGMFIGLFDALLVAFLFCAPLYTLIGGGTQQLTSMMNGADAISETVENKELADDVHKIREKIGGVLTSVRSSPVIRISEKPILNFGRSAFGLFTCQGHFFNVYDVLEDGAEIVLPVLDFAEKKPEEYGTAEVETLEKILDRGQRNKFFYGIISDGAHIVDRILSDSEDIPTLKLFKTVLEPFTECSLYDIEEGAQGLTGIFKLAVEYEVFANYKNSDVLLEKISDERFIDEVIRTLRSSELLSETVDQLLLVSLDVMNFSSVPEKKELYNQNTENIREKIRNRKYEDSFDVDREILAFTYLTRGLKGVYDSTSGFKSFQLETVDSNGLSEMLLGMGLHPYIGTEGVRILMTEVVPVLDEREGSLFVEKFMDNAVNSLMYDLSHLPSPGVGGKLANLLESTKNMTNVFDAMSSGGDQKKVENLIERMLKGMSLDSALTISQSLSAQTVANLAGGIGNKVVASEMISILMVKMAENGETDAEKLAKENTAIAKMMMLTVNANEKIGRESLTAAMGGNIKAFVKTVIVSDVMMNTLDETVRKYGNDPTDSFKNLTDDDRIRMKNACTEVLSEQQDTCIKERLDVLCYFMGVE